VALDAYGWGARILGRGANAKFYRAPGSAMRPDRRNGASGWGMMFPHGICGVWPPALSATDIYDEDDRAVHRPSWPGRRAGAAFITGPRFVATGRGDHVHQPIRRPDPIRCWFFVIGLLPGVAAVIVGLLPRKWPSRRDRATARRMAWRFERALEFAGRNTITSAARKSIMAGALEPELSAYCQAIFAELGHGSDALERRMGRNPTATM